MERFVDQSPEAVSRVFDTNLKGASLMAQEAARSMVQRGQGSIINIASSSGCVPAARCRATVHPRPPSFT
ncbi:protein of unknown function (plasmid) [Cupriavidus taiwanensis]|uniref:Uncharacterized protein n=1 Tax=Cupriavidus taiwanensis TaxID=164546 RepID=A0A375IQC4_9BURK|nr:SDR family NAD(P)-dependent oxidoreductase [Cupriavidus taiwanensis]SPA52457.1 hypothetical protein CBM2629_B40398 [Cupriavidus taiwanensis]SPK75672.1 protein of unknown function [Cupriavidus taiwanensis]